MGYSFWKTIQKAVKGAVIAGGSSTLATLGDLEKWSINVACAATAAAVSGVWNWVKNRKK